MISIITNYNKLKNHIIIKHHKQEYHNVFVSNELEEYWKYLHKVFYRDAECNKSMTQLYKNDDLLEDIDMSITVSNNYNFEFLFDDETTALYFKLKFN